jgi:hypothetical protein
MMFGLALVLFRRPTAPPHAQNTQRQAREQSQNIDLAAVTQSSPIAGSQVDKILVPLDVYLEINNDPTITCKRKLRIVLRNESGRHITVRATSWQRRSNDDIQLRSQDRYLWQIEDSPGSWEDNKWRPGETTEISAGPGAAIWTYIGLHDQATDHGVRRRSIQGRLGTLVVVLMTNGQMVEQRISLGPIRT